MTPLERKPSGAIEHLATPDHAIDRSNGVTVDSLLFLIFGFAAASLLSTNFIAPYLPLTGGTLVFYLIIYAGFLAMVVVGGKNNERAPRHRFWIASGATLLVLIFAFSRQLSVRGPSGLPVGIHDGAVHTEVAAKAILGGGNPYEADYRGTPYADVNPSIPGGPTVNVVWSHYIYPPLTFLLQAPWTLLADGLGLVPDVRLVYGLAFLVITSLLVVMTGNWQIRTTTLVLGGLNPFVWLYVLVGYNDVVPALGLVVAAWAGERQRWRLAGISVALALAAKQSAWVALPLWLVWLWARRRRGDRQSWKLGLTGTLTGVAIIFVPFVVWNGAALYDDIVRYASGAIPFSYPISGSTALQYLRVWGLVQSPWTVLPTHLFQLIVGLPVLVLASRWLWQRPGAERFLTAVVVLSLSILLVSRYFNNNYLTTLILLGVAAYAFKPPARPESSDL
ncbi:MAG: DUF2029 domain-containing protein [Candidatus Kerfeldbacteria bacterium]|nr:DUF2029 domain-containing protein [Candidatus Kerfeldbacteria bacterium]